VNESADSLRVAREALDTLGTDLADHQQLNVQCRRNHHVAAVYETSAGLVYRAVTGPRAHGSRDREDTAHKAARHGHAYVDLLRPSPMADDGLPAWCDCGSWTLSRSELLAQAHGKHRTLRLPEGQPG
jgi:hypothetical protein